MPKSERIHFNPRSPCGERRAKIDFLRRNFFISIHAPRVGSDRKWVLQKPQGMDFNPRSPCGERRVLDSGNDANLLFQSTLPVWGATYSTIITQRFAKISIHAPRVGSDVLIPTQRAPSFISIHAPRVGSDDDDSETDAVPTYFNPRSPCGERPAAIRRSTPVASFQSTLPVWGATFSGRPGQC